MRAQVFLQAKQPLQEVELATPVPERHQVLLSVRACGVCRTDLHVVDGELAKPKLPLVPGHEIVGRVVGMGSDVDNFALGDRVGVPWLGWTCGECAYCRRGQENLCTFARFTGYQIDGGYASHTVADARYCFRIPRAYSDVEAAPLLCAGLIGYRALRMAGDARRIGLYGFGAAAHILAQLCVQEGREVYAFVRPGDEQARSFALKLGVVWCGNSNEPPPQPLDAALIFAPAGDLIPASLRAVDKGGIVICAGIHMSDIPAFAYDLLWGERVLRSVANLTRFDGEAFFAAIAKHPVRTEVHTYALSDANRALSDLRAGRFSGAAVLVPAR
ncbi:MAG: zinc-dependent alcohol dehydrogenase family protein [Rudaea sp.]|nr:zinc-dependent alcohol dehydrogenase family protein [Rudaea sp.]